MFAESASFDNFSNLGFNVNPNIQDSTLRALNLREQKQLGMYYWANSDRDPDAAAKARNIFGRGMVQLADKENAAYYAGLSELQDLGIADTPYSYFLNRNIPIPEKLETDEDVYMYVGQKLIDRHRALKDATDKATEDLNELGEELPGAIATAVRGDDLDVSKTFNPELREKLMELQEWDGVEQSLKRAQTAWLYMASYMGSPEDLRAATREDLRYIADSLKDDSGNMDERAMAAFQIAVESRAKEMQSWDGNFWKNVGFGLEDVSERWKDHFTRPDEPNADEERLYGTLLSAINTSVQAADGASSINKTLASFGYLTGEMTPAVIAGSTAGLAAAPAGLVAGAIASGATTSATTYVPTANQAIASAYVQGKENPELQGRIEGAAEAAVEGIAGTIPGGIIAGKVAGKFIGKAASLAAGSRLLSNSVTQSTLRFFGGNTLQGLGELAEEEAGAALSAGLNSAFRAAGYNLTAEQYEFGKAWGEMPAHQVAAIFCYTSALGVFGLPSNIQAAREYARSSDNLLMVGHSEAAARDITEKQYLADAEKESIITSDLSIEEKAEKLAAIDERMDAYRSDKYRTDVLEASQEEIERRKKRENDDFTLATEAMMYIQNGVAERALERANITASIPTAGNKVTFLLENKDSKTGEVTMEERTVTKKQFASWLMTERNKELRQSMRNFQSQLTAKKLIESVRSSDDIKHEIINLHGAPANLITELKNHEAITVKTLELLANHAKNEIAALRAKGMSEQQARMQSSSLFKGVRLQHVAELVTASQQRQANEAATSSGEISGITTDTKIEHPAFRLPRMDGTSVIVYAEGRAGVNHIVEELLESHLAQELASGTTNINTLAEQLKTIEKQLPGKIKLLPKGKQSYSFGDIVEAYSKIAQANFLYNEAYLPLDKGGHRLVQNILRNVQAARIYKVLGEAYKNFANSEKGKAYLANGGKSLVDIMHTAGFTLGSRFESIQQEADKAVAEMEARNLLPSPKQEAEQLIQDAKDQQELAEINAKEAEQPIVVPAEESITGEREELPTNDKLTENPQVPQPELSAQDKLLAKLRTPQATARDFALYFRDNPTISEAQAIELGIRIHTQKGSPTAAYTQGRLISQRLTPKQFEDYTSGKLKGNGLKKILTPPEVKPTVESSQEQEHPSTQEQTQEAALADAEKNAPRNPKEELQDAGRHILANKDFARKLSDSLSQELSEQVDNISIPKYFPIPDYEKLINNGTDQRAIALLCYLRNSIPDKPRGWRAKGHRGEKWIKIFNTHREIARALIAGELDADAVLARLDEYHNMGMSTWNKDRDYTHNVYAAIGWPACSNIPKDVRVDYSPSIWSRDKGNFAGYSVTSGKNTLEYAAETLPEIIVYFLLKYSGEAQQGNTAKPKAKSKLAIYSHAQQGGITYHVGASVPGGVHVKLSQDFKTSKEARAHLHDNLDALEAKYKQLQKEPELREAVSDKARIGKDYRQGKNVDNETFMRTFGINGITYGNWVAGAARQAKLNATYDAFMDLAEVLGIPPRAISLNGSLGIQFGAAGRKGSAAHYRAADVAINLNRDTGDGSLAHEWWHALDNYFMRQGGKPHDFASYAAGTTHKYLDEKLLPIHQYMEASGFMNANAAYAFRQLIKAVNYSQYKMRSSRMKSMGGAKYWASNIELTARLFETYVREKINATGRNDFLARFRPLESFESADQGYMDATGKSRYPYPTAEEMQEFTPLLDNFFSSLTHTPQEDGNVATFSIAAAPRIGYTPARKLSLAERMSFYLHREAKRFARILGNKTPHDTAVNAIASANAVISMLDKYVHTNKIPLGRNERTRLSLLQRLIEKYAEIIKVGGTRSFNKISKTEQGVLDNILAEISTGIEEGQTKDNAKERYQELVRQAAKGRVWALLSEMMQEAGDILDAHLKSELLEKMKRITKGVKIKRTPSKKLKGKMTAAGYRDLEQAVSLMAMSQRAKQDEEEAVDNARRYLINNVGEPIKILRKGTDLLSALADRIERNGQKLTEENLNQQLTYYSNAVQVFGDIQSKDYKQTKAAAAALYMLVNYHRTKWQDAQEAKTAHVKAHLQYFLDNTTSEMGRDNYMREVVEKAKGALTFLPDSMMNTAQLFLSLASFKGLQPLFNEIRYAFANAQTAREVHLRSIREQELAAFGRIIGIIPATKAGYTKLQLNKISDAFDSFYQDNNQTHQTDIAVKWMEENAEGEMEQHEEKLKATNWQLLGIILNYRQPHYKTNAELHGFTQEVLDKIEAHIGEKLMAFGNAIQQIIINDGTMQVYEEREGIPMRDEPLYFPGSININTLNTTREEPLAHAYHPAAMHDFLHTRVRHRNEIKATNAYAAYRSAIADRANYIYLDPTTDVITRLLAHNEFANRLKSLIGPNLFKQLLATISQIKGAGYQESSMQGTGGLDFAGALTSKALGVLSGNIASHIRQLSAVANAGLMPDISPLDIPKYVNLGRSGKGRISITGVLKLDAFETRRRDNSFVNEMAAMDNNVKYSKLLKWAKAGVNTMDKLDVLANAVSATVVYNHKYDELKAMGHLTEAEIEKRCEQEVNAYVRLLAQPLTKVDKSALYWMVSNWALGRALLFMSSEAVNKIGMLRANYIIKRNNGQNPIKAAASVLAAMGMSVGLASFINESIIAGLTGNTPDDDDSLTAWAIATYLNATIGQYLEVMPLVGAFSRQIFSPYGKLENDSITIPGSDFYKRSSKLWSMLTDDKDYSGAEWQKQITRFMRELTSVLGYAGGAYSRWQWFSNTSAMLQAMTTTLNSVYFVAQAATNKAEWTEILPESYTTSEADAKKIKRGKSAKPKRMKSAIEEALTPKPEKKSKKGKGGKTSKESEISRLLLL